MTTSHGKSGRWGWETHTLPYSATLAKERGTFAAWQAAFSEATLEGEQLALMVGAEALQGRVTVQDVTDAARAANQKETPCPERS